MRRPRPGRFEAKALHAVMGNVGILRQGVGWTDYTMSFDTRVVDNQAGWLVRASSTSSGYLLALHHAASGTGTSNSLIEIALGPTEFAIIGQVVLPKSFDAAAWHHVTTQVSGSTITTSLDGRQVASFDTDALPAGTSVYGTGSVGFAELGILCRVPGPRRHRPDGSDPLCQQPVGPLGPERLRAAPTS